MVFIKNECLEAFPHLVVTVSPLLISDHTPLCIDTNSCMFMLNFHSGSKLQLTRT